MSVQRAEQWCFINHCLPVLHFFLSVWQLIPRPALAAFSSESSAWFPAAPLKFYSALILICVVEPPHCSILLNRNRPVKFLLVFSHHRLSPLVSIFL